MLRLKLLTSDMFAECCTNINVTLSGKAEEFAGHQSGMYTMYEGTVNNQNFWVSPNLANALWYAIDVEDDTQYWGMGYTSSLGYYGFWLKRSVQDAALECPYESLSSNWTYGLGNWTYVESNTDIKVDCMDIDW